MGQH
jgi:hypothetical protein